jgi:murein DD-endopeptidase MepM/ murein hydrolase activator NlpD
MEVEIVNMKKLFPDNKISRKGLLEFLDKKGFYIVLILCIAIVGITAVFVTTRNNISSSNQDYNAEKIIPDEMEGDIVSNAADTDSAKAPIGDAASIPEQKASPADTGKTAAAGTQSDAARQAADKAASDSKKTAAASSTKATVKPASTSKPSASKTTEKTKELKFIMPVFGNVIFDYAQDKLLYSKTLEEWRTHSGIDLSAERGATIKAVADGVVSDIKNDPRYGVTVVINHQNGVSSVYSNLASNDMVTPNQKVKQGDIIGCVGNTAIFESADESHLHFEVLKDGEPANPADFLPLKK